MNQRFDGILQRVQVSTVHRLPDISSLPYGTLRVWGAILERQSHVRRRKPFATDIAAAKRLIHETSRKFTYVRHSKRRRKRLFTLGGCGQC